MKDNLPRYESYYGATFLVQPTKFVQPDPLGSLRDAYEIALEQKIKERAAKKRQDRLDAIAFTVAILFVTVVILAVSYVFLFL